MKMVQKNKLTLSGAILLISLQLYSMEAQKTLPYSCDGISELSFSDSISIAEYEFQSKKLELIRQVIMDSCVNKFACNKLEQVKLFVKDTSGCLELEIRNMNYYPVLSTIPGIFSNLARFEINGTYFFLDEQSIKFLDFFKSAVFQKTTFLSLSTINYECLNKEVEGEAYDVSFMFKFMVCPTQEPELEYQDILIESGDVGYFVERPRIWKRISLFFKKL